MPNLKVIVKDIYPLDTDGFLADLVILNLDTRMIAAQNVFEIELAGGYVVSEACLAATKTAIAGLVNTTYGEDFPGLSLTENDIIVRTSDFFNFGSVPAIYSNSAQVASGQVVFYLTDDKTSGGDARFSSVDLKSVQITVHKKTIACPAEAVSLSGVTLTIDVNKVVVALGILDVTQDAPDGTDVGVLIHGTPA